MGLFGNFLGSSDQKGGLADSYRDLLNSSNNIEGFDEGFEEWREAQMASNTLEGEVVDNTSTEVEIDDDFFDSLGDSLDDPFEIWEKKVNSAPHSDASKEHQAACDYLECERERLSDWAKKLGVE